MKTVLLTVIVMCNPLEALRPSGALQADSAYKAAEFDKALALYEDLVVNNPSDMQSLYNAGKAATKAKKFTQAKAAFAHVESSQHSPAELKKQALFNRADVELLESNYDAALSLYEDILKIDSAHEGAKKRIELIKKLKEQQKQKNGQDSDQKKDKKKKESSSPNNKALQDKDQEKEQQKGNDKAAEQSKNERSNDKQGGEQDSQKPHDKGDAKKSSQKNREPQGSQAPQSSNSPQAKQSHEQKSGQEETQGNRDRKTQNQEHAQPQYKDTMTEQKEQKSSVVATTPEQQLNEQEKELLSKVEKHDRKVYKTYFARSGSQNEQKPGHKNW